MLQQNYIDKTWLIEFYFSVENTISKRIKFTTKVMPTNLHIKKADSMKYGRMKKKISSQLVCGSHDACWDEVIQEQIELWNF